MKSIYVFLLTTLFCLTLISVPLPLAENFTLDGEKAKSPVMSVEKTLPGFFGRFVGRVPGEKNQPIKTALLLIKDPKSGKPATYILERILVGKGNDRHITKGKWSVRRGANNHPEAEVYQLDAEAPEDFRNYWHVDKDLLLMLDRDLKVQVGTGAWSFTLSRLK